MEKKSGVSPEIMTAIPNREPTKVDEAIMIEPTETESRETLDAFINAMIEIAKEVDEKPEFLHAAPYCAPSRRLNEAKAARNPDFRWEMSSQ